MTYHRPHDTDTDALHVEIVDTLDGLDALRPAWEALQARDPEANVFLTWHWLARALRENPFRWTVLVARDARQPGEALCILPLKYRTHWSRSREEFQTRLEAGGRLVFSEYTGFLCHPEFETQALGAVADALTRMPWTRLSMRYVSQLRRCNLFTDLLRTRGIDLQYRDYLINKKTTDNLLCPQVDLPEDFDSYLANQVSANRRQKLNKRRRQHLESGDLTLTRSKPETFEADLEVLLDLWMRRWGKQKGSGAAAVAANYRTVVQAAQATGTLFLPMLKQGDTPLGALAHIVDRDNGIVHFIVGGRDPEAGVSGIGDLLHFHAIDWAIGQGFVCYDFGHGNEKYKYSYGSVDQKVLFFEARRPYDPEMAFDFLCAGEALRRTAAMLKDGKTEAAMKACLQLGNVLSG